MANLEHLEILKQGKGPWNQWRKENPDITPDLSNADLSEITFDEWGEEDGNEDTGVLIDINDPSLENFPGIDLSDAIMDGTKLSGALFFYTHLSTASLRNVSLACAFVNSADLEKAILIEANIARTEFQNVNLDGADLT